MRHRAPLRSIRRRHVLALAIGAATVGMWAVTASQLSGGAADVLVFAPPAAVLGLAAVWAGHMYAPRRFTWRRGLYGVLAGGGVISPLMAALVTLAAAWQPASFLIVFNVGAWLALALGLAVGATIGLAHWVARWRRRRKAARHRERPPLQGEGRVPDSGSVHRVTGKTAHT